MLSLITRKDNNKKKFPSTLAVPDGHNPYCEAIHKEEKRIGFFDKELFWMQDSNMLAV